MRELPEEHKATGALDKQLAVIKARIEENERTGSLQLPLWPEAKRGTPNSFIRSALFSAIQGKDRQFLKDYTVASQDGITVKFTGEQLNQEDLTLWENLVHLAKQHPLGNVCNFTAHGILKTLELNTGGAEHRRLHLSIIRLTACAVQISTGKKTYFGPLVKAGVKDELTSHYAIELNRELIRLFGENDWSAIDWKQRLALRRKPLAQALHAYYSSHRYPYPVTVAFFQRITGSRNASVRDFKRKLREALDELQAIGFIYAFEIKGDLVTVRRNQPKAIEQPSF
jgi:hypothetical protein